MNEKNPLLNVKAYSRSSMLNINSAETLKLAY
jgi:hypothetical protein